MIHDRRYAGPALEVLAAAEAACARIPPMWPLEEAVAVNPYLGHAEDDLATAAARMARVAGARVTLERAEIAARIEAGTIGEAHLAAAAHAAGLAAGALREAASRFRPAPRALPTVADLAARATGTGWPAIVAERLGTVAAAHMDRGQALWAAPPGRALWQRFVDYARRDLTPSLAGLPGLCARVDALPVEPQAALAAAAAELGIEGAAAETAFHRLLIDLGGWAQAARLPGWQAERHDGRDTTLLELLTARLVWEAALLERFEASVGAAWREALAAHAAPVAASEEDRLDAALHDAAERAAQAAFFAGIPSAPAADAGRPALQAAFCIDVRSEVLRRALEAQAPGIETFGFAGFFGLAIEHRPAASDTPHALLPVLIDPALRTRSSITTNADGEARVGARASRAWRRFKTAAVSSFAFVEAAGPLYLGKIVADGLGRGHAPAAEPAPVPAADWPLADRAAAAAGILRAMSLTGPFARVVILAGHGARVVNNPHAATLQCGACGGRSGEINARLLAGLLNDADVRRALPGHGLDVPEDTRFVGALHDTVTDELTLYEDAPWGRHAEAMERARGWLARAAADARAERGVRLPGAGPTARGRDWAQVRPEWALAGCMAFVAAPRHRTRGADLGGRAFLHGYDWRADEDRSVLELILTAPVVVASWISLQYHGSTLAPEIFGGGDKVLHNVTGGIGVVEGNGGRLRPGLPMQSVHDGERPMHDPLRLAVVIEAPAEAIDAILAKHEGVAQLFDNGWLSLHRMDDEGRIAQRRAAGGGWEDA